jgi:hypothetical protein
MGSTKLWAAGAGVLITVEVELGAAVAGVAGGAKRVAFGTLGGGFDRGGWTVAFLAEGAHRETRRSAETGT